MQYAYWILAITSLNSQLSLDNLNTRERRYYNCLIQDFEADFLWKVSFKILNSGIILKTFTHVITKLESGTSNQTTKQEPTQWEQQ